MDDDLHQAPNTVDLPHYRRPISPDHELLVWEKWIQIRKEETTKLGQKLHRPPVDLTMNLLKDVRKDKERKVALEHAKIDKKPKLREGLFEQPLRLTEKYDKEPPYEVQRTRSELGRPPIIEHIGVPNHIQKTELGMAGEPKRQAQPKLDRDYVDYRDKKETDLAKKIKKIDPFRPSMSKLIVQGFQPKPTPPKVRPPPTVTIAGPTSKVEDALSDVYAIQINKTILYKEWPGQNLQYLSTLKKSKQYEDCTSWTYYFNVPMKRIGRGKLFLQNIGTVAVKYCWKKSKYLLPFIPTDVFSQVFFFNTNEDVISPGQSRHINFTFVSDKPGIFYESWEIIFTDISFFDTGEKLTVNLCADSIENAESAKRKVEDLKIQIYKETVSNIVDEVLIDVFDRVIAPCPQTYPYKKYFLEAELFVMKNPVCFYHQTEVAKMAALYQEMTGGTWDLSIATWRQAMMAKEFDERMAYYGMLKKSHADFLKPWYEGDTLQKEKCRAINNLWRQLADKLDQEYARLVDLFVPKPSDSSLGSDPENAEDITVIDPITKQKISNIFYLHAYDHVANTIEQCAGVLSSLELNKWIEFNFCQG